MSNQIYFKIAGKVDLDMLNMFAVSTYHLSLIVFEIKDEKVMGKRPSVRPSVSFSHLNLLL
jgi:hypothetical protein